MKQRAHLKLIVDNEMPADTDSQKNIREIEEKFSMIKGKFYNLFDEYVKVFRLRPVHTGEEQGFLGESIEYLSGIALHPLIAGGKSSVTGDDVGHLHNEMMVWAGVYHLDVMDNPVSALLR